MPVRLFHKVAFGADGAPAPRARWCSTAPATTAAIRSAPPKCASCASSRTRRWRSRPSTRPGRIARTNALFRPPVRGRAQGRGAAAARSSRSSPSATAPALEAAIRKAADGQGDIAPVDAALAGAGERSATLLRHRGRGGGPRRRGGDRLRARDHRAAHAGEPDRRSSRRWSRSASSPAASRTTSTTCCRAIMMATDFLLNAHKPTDPSLPGHHADQAERQPRRRAGAAAAGVLAQADAAAAGARPRRGAVRPRHAAAPADRREGHARGRRTAATCGRSRSTSRSSSR